MQTKTHLKILFVGLCCIGFVSAQAGVTRDHAGPPTFVPTGKGWGEYLPTARGGKGPGGGSTNTVCTNGICYRSGSPVISNTANVYYIWYGNWSGNTAPTILEDLATNIGGSPYFDINQTYYQTDAAGNNVVPVSGSVAFPLAGVTDNYSRGTRLRDSDVTAIVSNAITSRALPSDPNGVYFVLTSADVSETSGFCKMYCGWHTHGKINGTDIKYAFVGNPDQCPNACEEQTSSSPNNNPGADGMASVIAHELEETVTDPDLNAWYDQNGQENADKCAWKFGTTSKDPNNGSSYNVTIGSLNYLIQQNWVNGGGGYCAMALP